MLKMYEKKADQRGKSKMIEIGRLCVKVAGRDAGHKCVVIDIIDKNYALIEGDVRRRKCNIAHLEPLDKKLDIKKMASREEVAMAFKELGIELVKKKTKPKTERPKKQRKGIKAEEKPVESKVKKKSLKKPIKKEESK